jgi:hypothetical protein
MKKGLWWSGSDVGRAPTTFFSFTIRSPFYNMFQWELNTDTHRQKNWHLGLPFDMIEAEEKRLKS